VAAVRAVRQLGTVVFAEPDAAFLALLRA